MPTAIRRTCIVLGIAAVVVTTLAYAENIRLRTGEWDFTLTGLGSAFGGAGGPPPEARAQLAKPVRYKSCITEKDLAELVLGPPDDEDDHCKVTSNKVTAQTADITQTCSGDNARTQKIHVDASSPETLAATVDITSARGSAHLTIAGKWIGATCTDSD